MNKHDPVLGQDFTQCDYCSRLKSSGQFWYSDGWTCGAFPKKIPESILLGTIDHRRPIPEDGGRLFEPKVEGELDEILEMTGQELKP